MAAVNGGADWRVETSGGGDLELDGSAIGVGEAEGEASKEENEEEDSRAFL